ncbi:MAG: hypothetical protein WA324_15965, partial [Bryobacteraceae bacterium]
FLPSTTAYFQINSLYVDTGKHKVLIDNGMGPYLGPSGGYLPRLSFRTTSDCRRPWAEIDAASSSMFLSDSVLRTLPSQARSLLSAMVVFVFMMCLSCLK